MTLGHQTEPPPAGVRGFFHGIGEVAGFARAGGWAVLELCLGRWPAPPPTPRRHSPGEGPGDSLGPFPMHD